GTNLLGEETGDSIGQDVALSDDGSRMIVGAYRNNNSATRAGRAYVYEWDGTTWVLLGSPIDGDEVGDNAGWSVDISGDGNRIAVGLISNDGGGDNAGSVRIYEWSGADWIQLGSNLDGIVIESAFGESLALSGDGNRIVIAAPSYSVFEGEAGRTQVYEWNGNDWVQLGDNIDGQNTGDRDGSAVAISSDGSIIAIGAKLNDDGGNQAGQVRVFSWSGTAWVQLGADLEGIALESVGASVSLSADGTRLAYGAESALTGATGATRIFEWDGSSWNQVGTDISGDAENDGAGNAVELTLDGNRIVIGAPDNDVTAPSAGLVRVYDWDGTDWIEVGQGVYGDVSFDDFGDAVAIAGDGSRMAAGSTETNGNLTRTGQVKTFDIQLVSCLNTATDEVEVFDLPEVTLSALGSFCEDQSAVTLGGGLPEGGVYSGTGVTDNGNGQDFTFDPSAVGPGVYPVTYTFVDPATDCAASATVELEVLELPEVSFTAPTDLCIDAGIQEQLSGGLPEGGIYSGPGVTDNGNGQTYSFDPAAVGAGVQTIEYTVTTGETLIFDNGVSLDEVNEAIRSDDDVSDYAADDFSFSESGTISSVSWSGAYAFDNTPPATDDFTIRIYTDDGGSVGTLLYSEAVGNAVNRVMEVEDLFGFDVYSYNAAINFAVSAGTTYWLVIYSNTINEADNWFWSLRDGGGGNALFSENLSSWRTNVIGEHDFELSFPNSTPCTVTAMDDIEVLDLPTVTFNNTTDFLCLGASVQNVPLGGGLPVGGVYSGPGVTDAGNGTEFFFDPTVATIGRADIIYTFTDANGCTSADTSFIDVDDCQVQISDPCGCLDNATPFDVNAGTGGDDGQFAEMVRINGFNGAG
ncbi:MAG: hypothetical protein AAFQ37_06840, partial [Bacteroidota bacterium]